MQSYALGSGHLGKQVGEAPELGGLDVEAVGAEGDAARRAVEDEGGGQLAVVAGPDLEQVFLELTQGKAEIR